MKFARYLEENVVVEWQRAYINYRGLKKLIKRVDARYKARTALELSKTTSHASSSVRNGISAAVEGLRRRQRRLSSASGGEASDAPIWSSSAYANNRSVRYEENVSDDMERQDRLPQVTLDGLGIRLTADVEARLSELQPQTTADTDDTLTHKAASSMRRTGTDGDGAATETENDIEQHASSSNGKPYPKKPKEKKKRKAERNQVELNDLVASTFDQQERLFFAALDSELERIVDFYNTREQDMAKRFEMLARQLDELSEHRREYKAQQAAAHQRIQEAASEGWGADLGVRFSHLVAPLSQPAAQTLKRASVQLRRDKSPTRKSLQINNETVSAAAAPADKITEDHSVDEGDKRRAAALAKMLNMSGGTLSESEDAELRHANRLAAMSHDPERYKAARKKLKMAVLEYYRGLEILKNYKILNRTGFAKILKKFEKTTEVHCADAYYHAKVAPSVLVSSETVEKLLKGTEEIYTAYFEHGNRKRALERLRIHSGTAGEQQSTTHHFSASRTGFYLGVSVSATVAGIVSALHDDTPSQIPLWDQLMRVYGALFIPTLFTLLFGLNLGVWHYSRVNAVFIFEWDVRHVLDFHQFFELPAFFMLLLSLCFWVSFLNPFPQAIAATTWPLVWLVIVAVVMLNPLPMFYYHARRWLVVSLARVFQAGVLSRVEFRDFFLGDELNSLAWSISMLWFIGCQYNHNWHYPNQCDPNGTFWTAVLLALPAFLRFVQCFRRWRDSRFTANLHLINAGKYASSILQAFMYINWRYHGSPYNGLLALWCVFASIYSLYTSAWDIIMDWSLLQPRARFPFLRNELVYEHYWPCYYFAMVTDVILRFAWTIYLLPGPARPLMKIFVIALLESLRRWQWAFFRLENEHLGNVDMYRVSREVPLPYHQQQARQQSKTGGAKTDDDDDDDLEATGVKNQKRIPAFGPQAMMRLVRNKGKDGEDDTANVDTQGDGKRDEWHPNHYPPTRSLSTTQGAGASLPALSLVENGKGKQVAEESALSFTSTTRKNDGESEIPPEDVRGDRGRQGSSSVARRIRDALVPDRGGLASAGPTLAGEGGAHGVLGRDYEPRRRELGSDGSDDDSDADARDDDDDDDHIPDKIDRKDR